MDAYDDMQHAAMHAGSFIPAGKCSEGVLLQTHWPPGETVIYICPCGHRFEKSVIELEMFGPREEIVFPCPRTEQKS